MTPPHSRRRPRRATAALAFGLVLAACTPGASGSGTAGANGTEGGSGSDAGLTRVVYLTSFNTFGRDSYAFLAEERGYFEEAGFEVEIRPGSGSTDVMRLIATGTADYGIADLSATIVGVSNAGFPVAALASIHQRSTTALFALKSSGIAEPTDLEGRVVGDQPGSVNQVIFPTWAREAGVDPEQVTFVPTQPATLPQLLASHQVDAIGQLTMGQPLIQKVAGDQEEVVVLRYADHLPVLYGNVLLTTDANAESEEARAFADALLRGLEDAIADPEAAAAALVAQYPTQSPEVAALELELMVEAVTGDGEELGSIEEARVEEMIDVLSESLSETVTTQDVLAPGVGS